MEHCRNSRVAAATASLNKPQDEDDACYPLGFLAFFCLSELLTGRSHMGMLKTVLFFLWSLVLPVALCNSIVYIVSVLIVPICKSGTVGRALSG